jgi:hypothetical protein
MAALLGGADRPELFCNEAKLPFVDTQPLRLLPPGMLTFMRGSVHPKRGIISQEVN